MQPEVYLHEHPQFQSLIRILAVEKNLPPALVEKDYWIMHCLYGLEKLGLTFELKGGTSLSKGYNLLDRFSEDIDIHIDPVCAPFKVASNPNQVKKDVHIQSRKAFYDWLATELIIDGITEIVRDTEFDDDKYRSGGIRLLYQSYFEQIPDMKEGILLEVGFDDTAPNHRLPITSWAFERAQESDVQITDNRAVSVPCYHPGYTFVEKLQTVSTKFRVEQAEGTMPKNFMRHYYDLSQLLAHPDVQSFIGTDGYHERKEKRFRAGDNLVISENEAFLLHDAATRERYHKAYNATSRLYFGVQPSFDEILNKIQAVIDRL